jgi:hypothetical protein
MSKGKGGWSTLVAQTSAITSSYTSRSFASEGAAFAALNIDITTITMPSTSCELDFYLQTSYDGGTKWTDVENFHFGYNDDGATARRLGVIDGAMEGPGTMKSITGTDPAAGNEIVETVPAGAVWKLQSFRAQLVAASTAANRYPGLRITDGTNQVRNYSNAVAQTASQSITHEFKNVDVEHGSRNGNGNHITDFPIKMLSGYKALTSTQNLQAEDNWGAPQFTVEEWHDPVVLTTGGTIRDNVRSYQRPLGSHIRLKTSVDAGTSAPTYSFSATVYLR